MGVGTRSNALIGPPTYYPYPVRLSLGKRGGGALGQALYAGTI